VVGLEKKRGDECSDGPEGLLKDCPEYYDGVGRNESGNGKGPKVNG
jgi:hypothetical protein